MTSSPVLTADTATIANPLSDPQPGRHDLRRPDTRRNGHRPERRPNSIDPTPATTGFVPTGAMSGINPTLAVSGIDLSGDPVPIKRRRCRPSTSRRRKSL